jgi:formate dehydrogenase subunit delta
MNVERLVHMANQIAKFFAAYPRPQAIEGVADHLRKFWDPRMRRELFAHVDKGGAGLHELVLAAVATLRVPEENRPH